MLLPHVEPEALYNEIRLAFRAAINARRAYIARHGWLPDLTRNPSNQPERGGSPATGLFADEDFHLSHTTRYWRRSLQPRDANGKSRLSRGSESILSAFWEGRPCEWDQAANKDLKTSVAKTWFNRSSALLRRDKEAEVDFDSWDDLWCYLCSTPGGRPLAVFREKKARLTGALKRSQPFRSNDVDESHRKRHEETERSQSWFSVPREHRSGNKPAGQAVGANGVPRTLRRS
jgi:hypothetical protein